MNDLHLIEYVNINVIASVRVWIVAKREKRSKKKMIAMVTRTIGLMEQ